VGAFAELTVQDAVLTATRGIHQKAVNLGKVSFVNSTREAEDTLFEGGSMLVAEGLEAGLRLEGL
jgi:hypothetical protein